MDLESSEEGKISSEKKISWRDTKWGYRSNISRDTFEGMLDTFSRTKESIGRASHHAIDCAKYSIVGEVRLISVIFQYGK